jgi:hypothetical protein
LQGQVNDDGGIQTRQEVSYTHRKKGLECVLVSR